MTTVTLHQPAEREAFAVVRDFAAAADRLAAMGRDWREGQFRKSDTTTAANALAGMNALLAELRTTNPNEG